jgi:3-deoxy-D-manno-octulosonic acid hydroxylase-like protein
VEILEVLRLDRWNEDVSDLIRAHATDSLEQGKIVFLPGLRFPIFEGEAHLLSPRVAGGKAKNISFDINSGELRGAIAAPEDSERLKALLSRFATEAAALVEKLSPRYRQALQMGRTSFRPVEITGRASSYRKDDTRLHVDAFPSSPVQDRRILRVFSNINPNAKERWWRVGAPFEDVARTFLPKARGQFWAEPALLRALRITKSRRTLYDHAMLQLHDRMKADMAYQASVDHTEIRFPAGSTWLMFSDQVSHAVMSGQHVLEQTLYVPVDAMADPSRSPLRVLERLSGSRLI